jgi:hypothetical protein
MWLGEREIGLEVGSERDGLLGDRRGEKKGEGKGKRGRRCWWLSKGETVPFRLPSDDDHPVEHTCQPES